MSPTVFRCRGYRFFFFSREEPRMHVLAGRGEAKFWLEPRVELAKNDHFPAASLREIEQIIEARVDELKSAWHDHFER